MSDFFQIPEIVSHIFHFLDKNTTKQISSVNRLFNHIAEYQLTHSLKSNWEKGLEQYQQIKLKYQPISVLKDLTKEISFLDDRTGLIFLINYNFYNIKQMTISVTHFYDSTTKVVIYQWTKDVNPLMVRIPPFLSHSRQPELYLALDPNDLINGAEYINLTNINSISSTTSIKRHNKKFSSQLYSRLFTELTGFSSSAPYWSDLINTTIIDNFKIPNQFCDEFNDRNFKRCYSSVSVNEFYVIIYNNNASFFTVYSFLASTNSVDRFDCTSLIQNHIKDVNLMDVVASINDQQWLIIHSIWEKPLAFNLKTKQCLEFHKYPNSFDQCFILFEPEPLLLIKQRFFRSFDLHLVTQNKFEFSVFKGPDFKSFLGFDDTSGAVVSLDLSLNEPKVISLFIPLEKKIKLN